MKPRHQLSRTPPKNNEKLVNEEVLVFESPQILSASNISFNIKGYSRIIIILKIIKREHSLSIIIDILYSEDMPDSEREVDWEQHTAQLIPCKKCKRTFMPHRIKKHEACCKKI